jgi:hypothetical protein
MAKQVKLGILRAHKDSSYPSIPGAACIEMMMTSSSRRSVFDYWVDNTYGYLDYPPRIRSLATAAPCTPARRRLEKAGRPRTLPVSPPLSRFTHSRRKERSCGE